MPSTTRRWPAAMRWTRRSAADRSGRGGTRCTACAAGSDADARGALAIQPSAPDRGLSTRRRFRPDGAQPGRTAGAGPEHAGAGGAPPRRRWQRGHRRAGTLGATSRQPAPRPTSPARSPWTANATKRWWRGILAPSIDTALRPIKDGCKPTGVARQVFAAAGSWCGGRCCASTPLRCSPRGLHRGTRYAPLRCAALKQPR